MKQVSINCDVGEGCANDSELMKYISSANIACGYHAGDLSTMKRTVEYALAEGVSIGAHPGYNDRDNFGRTAMTLPADEVAALVTEQLQVLSRVCESSGTSLHHVKPHGALYNQAAVDRELARTLAEAVLNFDAKLMFYGL